MVPAINIIKDSNLVESRTFEIYYSRHGGHFKYRQPSLSDHPPDWILTFRFPVQFCKSSGDGYGTLSENIYGDRLGGGFGDGYGNEEDFDTGNGKSWTGSTDFDDL